MDKTQPRIWYFALMDYGVYLKKTIGNLNKKSKTYTKQASFRGSKRQLRGQIIKLLTKNENLSLLELQTKIGATPYSLNEIVNDLEHEKLVKKQNNKISIA